MDDKDRFELIRWATKKKEDALKDAEEYKQKSSPEMWRACSYKAVAYQQMIDKVTSLP